MESICDSSSAASHQEVYTAWEDVVHESYLTLLPIHKSNTTAELFKVFSLKAAED